MQRAHLHIHGDVQGVGFRWHTRNQARQLRLVGWVRNRADGTVEAVVEGPEEAVDQFIAWCRRGPPSARVHDLRVERRQPTGELADFEIRRTE